MRLTVTNTGDDGGGDELACIRIQVPNDFTISSVGIVSVHGQASGPAYDDWVAVWPGGQVVTFKNPSDDYPLIGSTPPIDEAVVRITGTATAAGPMAWTVDGADHPKAGDTTSCGSGAFDPIDLSFTVTGAQRPRQPQPQRPRRAPTPKPTPKPSPNATAHAEANPSTARAEPDSDARYRRRRPVIHCHHGPTSPPASTAPSPSAGLAQTARPSAVAPDGPGATSTGGSEGSSGIRVGGGGPGSGAQGAAGGMGHAVFAGARWPSGRAPGLGLPAVVLTVPGLLLLLAIGAQALGALAWLPLVRRRVGSFGLGGRLTKE